jgi:uncharacterized protein YjiS (DUF1127 family)
MPTTGRPAGSPQGSQAIGPRLSRALAETLATLPSRLFDRLLTWQERAEQRQYLARLDDWMLRDIGLSRADVASETDKPFWRP